MAQLTQKPSAIHVPVVLFKDNEWSSITLYLLPVSEQFSSLKPKLIQSVKANIGSDVRFTLTNRVHSSSLSARYVVDRLTTPLADDKTLESYNRLLGSTIVVVDCPNQPEEPETSTVTSGTKITPADTLTQAQIRDLIACGRDFDGDIPVSPVQVVVTCVCRPVIGPSDAQRHTFRLDCHPSTTIEQLRKLVWRGVNDFEFSKYLLAEDAYEMVIRDPDTSDKQIVRDGILQIGLANVRQDRTVASLFVLGSATSAPIKLSLVLKPTTPVNFHVRLTTVTQQIVTLTVSDTVMALYERVRGVIDYRNPTGFTLAAIPVGQVPTKNGHNEVGSLGDDGDVRFEKTAIPKCNKTLAEMGLIKEYHLIIQRDESESTINAQTAELSDDKVNVRVAPSLVTVDFVGQPISTYTRACFDRKLTTSKDVYDYVSKQMCLSIDNFYLEWTNPRPAKHICPEFPLSNRKAFTHLERDECTIAVKMGEDGARVAHPERDCSEETDAQIFEELAKDAKSQKERKSIEDLDTTIGMLTGKVKLLNDIQVMLEHKKKYIEAAKQLGDSFDGGVSLALIEQVASFIPEVVHRTMPIVLVSSSWKQDEAQTAEELPITNTGATKLFKLVTLDSYLSKDGYSADMNRIDKELKEAKDKTALLMDIKQYKAALALKEELAAKLQEGAKKTGVNLDDWFGPSNTPL